MLKFKIISFFITTFCLISCVIDHAGTRIKLYNHLDYKVCTCVNIFYPDISFEKAYPNTGIEPNSLGKIYLLHQEWENLLKERGKITIYIVPDEICDKYDSVKKWYKPKMRYILSKADLEEIGWLINIK